MESGIYTITNTVSQKRYVGQAVDIRKRWRNHRSSLERGLHSNIHLQRAWLRYGSEAFVFEVVEVVADPGHLDAKEQRWMDDLRPEYNIAPQAGSTRGLRAKPETIARRVAALIGQKRTPEQCRRISEAKKVRIAERRALGIVQVSPMKGRKHSEEAKRLVSKSRRGKGCVPCSPEKAAKIAAAQRGRKVSAEKRLQISVALVGRSTGRGQLTPEQVREVRRLRKTEGLGRIAIARRLGITPSAASSVIGNHAYGWVT